MSTRNGGETPPRVHICLPTGTDLGAPVVFTLQIEDVNLLLGSLAAGWFEAGLPRPVVLASCIRAQRDAGGMMLLQLNRASFLSSASSASTLRDDDQLSFCVPSAVQAAVYGSSAFAFRFQPTWAPALPALNAPVLQPTPLATALACFKSDAVASNGSISGAAAALSAATGVLGAPASKSAAAALSSGGGAAASQRNHRAATSNGADTSESSGSSDSSDSSSSSDGESDSDSDSGSSSESSNSSAPSPQPPAAHMASTNGSGAPSMSETALPSSALASFASGQPAAAPASSQPHTHTGTGTGTGSEQPLDVSEHVAAALAAAWPEGNAQHTGGAGGSARRKRPRSAAPSGAERVTGVTVRLPGGATALTASDALSRCIACGDSFEPKVGDVLLLSVLGSAISASTDLPPVGSESAAAATGVGGAGLSAQGDGMPSQPFALSEPEQLTCRVVQYDSSAGALRVCLGLAHTQEVATAPVRWADASARVKRAFGGDISAAAELCVRMEGVISVRVLLGPSYALALLAQKRSAKALLRQASPNQRAVQTSSKTSASGAAAAASGEAEPTSQSQRQSKGAQGLHLSTTVSTEASQPKRRRHSKRYHKVAAQRSLGVGSFLAKLNKEATVGEELK